MLLVFLVLVSAAAAAITRHDIESAKHKCVAECGKNNKHCMTQCWKATFASLAHHAPVHHAPPTKHAATKHVASAPVPKRMTASRHAPKHAARKHAAPKHVAPKHAAPKRAAPARHAVARSFRGMSHSLVRTEDASTALVCSLALVTAVVFGASVFM